MCWRNWAGTLYFWLQRLRGTKCSPTHPLLPLSKWFCCLGDSCGFVGDKCLPKTVEDTDILPKANPDLRAYNPDARPILGCPRNSRKFLCFSEGGRPLVSYPSTPPG